MKVSEIVGAPHNKQKIYNMIKTKHQIVSNMIGFPYILQQTLSYKSKIPKSQKNKRIYRFDGAHLLDNFLCVRRDHLTQCQLVEIQHSQKVSGYPT